MPEANPNPFEPRPSSSGHLQPEGGVTYEPSQSAEPAGGEADALAASRESAGQSGRPRGRRRVRLPVILFVLTCFSTFLAGATQWMPAETLFYCAQIQSLMPLRQIVVAHWADGLVYMLCVLAILLTHEMGHFVMTVIYRVRASLPFFLPLPISPIGTLGAVIAMDGQKANRREIFDIGLAGPIAGLVVAIPIMWIGVQQLQFGAPASGFTLDPPLAMRLLIDYLQIPGFDPQVGIAVSQSNAFFMAGWVGLLVTGLNMMPVSQLDGGHVTYALFGHYSRWLARGFMIFVFAYIVYAANYTWMLMAVLVLMIGIDHPPTSDDKVSLGWFRMTLGLASLLIPVFCFVPRITF